MSLMDRDYMHETEEERIRNNRKPLITNEKERRISELWKLYGKEKKSIFDKIKIKILENKNRKEANS